MHGTDLASKAFLNREILRWWTVTQTRMRLTERSGEQFVKQWLHTTTTVAVQLLLQQSKVRDDENWTIPGNDTRAITEPVTFRRQTVWPKITDYFRSVAKHSEIKQKRPEGISKLLGTPPLEIWNTENKTETSSFKPKKSYHKKTKTRC